MKKTIGVLGIITLSVIIGFGILACDDGEGETEATITMGKITVIGLPEDLFISFCSVQPVSGGDFIGRNQQNTLGSDTNFFGHGRDFLFLEKYRLFSFVSESGNTLIDSEPTFETWNYTGLCNVRLTFKTIDDSTVSGYFTIPNVNFENGVGTVIWDTFSFTLPPTDGEFTLTEASEFNNKYAILVGAIDTNYAIYGFGDASSATAFKGYKIENGEVDIPVWRLNIPNAQFESYNGNDEILVLIIIILDTEEFDHLHYAANSTSYKTITYMTGYNPVTFSSGKAARTVSQGLAFGLD